MKLEDLKQKGEAGEWLTEEGLIMLKGGYLLPDETPRQAYLRCAEFSASVYGADKQKYMDDFFLAIWNNWLCPSSPVLSNANTKNLQISCYSGSPADDLGGIMDHLKELAMLTKYGGGVGSSFDNLRGAGAKISSGGTSSGIVPFLKMLDSVVDGTKQGASRRGAVASYLNIRHGDIDEFIAIRSNTGDLSRKIQSVAFHNAVTIDDEIMNRIVEGDPLWRGRWNKIMGMRAGETGEPYVMFTDNANKNCPEEYAGKITQSNLCSEIGAPVTPEETFVCCLSSLNLARWNEWKDYRFPHTGLSLVELSVYFLDAVITNFVKQTTNMDGMQNARRFAERHRMLGLGVLGWHSLLQAEGFPFESFKTMTLNNKIFKQIRQQAYKASDDLAAVFGPCEVNGKRRNTALLAIAPTMSNSLLSGGLSQGIEPITANLFSQKSAKGIFIRKNPQLLAFLKERNLDKPEIWEQINQDQGSVKNTPGISDDEKRIFLTAREINQYAIVQQIAQRQVYIDQMSSNNLFFSLPKTPEQQLAVAKYMNGVHLEAWKSGVKSLYYMKTESPLKGDTLFVEKDGANCVACEG